MARRLLMIASLMLGTKKCFVNFEVSIEDCIQHVRFLIHPVLREKYEGDMLKEEIMFELRNELLTDLSQVTFV